MTAFLRALRVTAAWCLFALAGGGCCVVPAGAASVPMRTFLKTEYASMVQVNVPRPNVLFLLDVGSPMTFSPKGIMPLATDGYSKAERAALLKECTYGSGARPCNESSQVEWERYGRDLDDSNNQVDSQDCYYTPDPSKPYFLTFRKPAHHKKKPSSYTTDDLVPNDSRMYMMKLVLWRLTQPENGKLLSGMNVGMATSYQEDSLLSVMYVADFYKRPNWGIRGAIGGNPALPYGSAPSWSIGFGSDGIYGVNDNYYKSQNARSGVNRDLYDKPIGSAAWRRINRSLLLVPFDRFYVESDVPASYDSTLNLKRFREYIDGVESFKGEGDNRKFTNPELFADGQTPLSTSLYARVEHKGHNDTSGQKLIQYANAPEKILYYGSGRTKDRVILKEYPGNTHTEKLVSGQAIGSAIDFFAPRKISSGTADGLAFSKEKAGYFPVTGKCQSNWVVIFTAGNDESNAPRTAAQAALELYKNTQGADNPVWGRRWDESKNEWVSASFDMEKGVRTLVVGFVDPAAGDDNSKKLRVSLNDIAAHGQPKKENGQWVKDENRKALFANDVPGLIRALNNVFGEIAAESRPTPSGAPLIQLDEEAGVSGKLFNSSYTPRLFDQWFSSFTCKELVFDPATNRPHLQRKWEAGAKMQAKGLDRPLYASEGKEANASVSVKRLVNFAPSDFKALAGVSEKEAEFRDWLICPLPSASIFEGPLPLGDMQNSNFMTVGPAGNEVIFFQTNRGVLHALDAETGEEKWGFIPPNVLQGRARVMKYRDGTGLWYDGDGKDSRRSMPVTLLDGLLSEGLVSQDQSRVLMGTLGNGGNGVYAMDITTVGTSPKFLWAVDNARYDVAETPPSGGVRRWGNAAQGGVAQLDYSDLGLTIQAVNLCNISEDSGTGRTVGILPGGLGYNLGVDSQGKAIFVLNPKNGAIEKKLDDSVLIRHRGSPAPLGMAVAPLTLIRTKKGRVLTEFFTGDSQGNVLSCDVSGKKPADWRLKSLFRLTTVAAGGVPPGKPVAIPKALLKLRKKVSRQSVLVGGTCDLLAPGSASDPKRKLHNDQQFIFCLQLDRLEGMETTGDLLPLTAADLEVVWANPGTLSADQKGWALKLKPAKGNYEDEFVTTAPFLYDNKLVVTTYRPQTVSQDVCVAVEAGESRPYILDVETGRARFRPMYLKDIKITGVTGMRGKLVFAAEEKRAGAISEAVSKNPELSDLGDNLLQLDLPRAALPPLKDGAPYLDYWRDFDTEMLQELKQP